MLRGADLIFGGGLRGGIPSGWVEVDYIESTGTQYLNLPFGFDPTDTIDAEFSIDTSQLSDKYIVSPISWNANNNRFAMGIHSSRAGSGLYTCAFGNQGTSATHLVAWTVNDGDIHRWTYSSRVFRITDLELSRDCTYIVFGSTTANLKLFYGYNSNTKGKVAKYKHIKASGVGVDLVAVRNAETNEGAMCDVLTGEIYHNAGTGAFVVGPDKT